MADMICHKVYELLMSILSKHKTDIPCSKIDAIATWYWLLSLGGGSLTVNGMPTLKEFRGKIIFCHYKTALDKYYDVDDPQTWFAKNATNLET